jgi:amino acid adenylation domain-containing protein
VRQPEGVFVRFEKCARARPDRIAVVDGDFRISYGALAEESARVADELVRAGVRSGELVGLRVSRGWRTFAAVLGIWRHGCAYVPVDPDAPAARAGQILAQAHLRHLVVDGVDRYAVEEMVAVGPPAEVPSDAAYVIFTSGSTGTPKGVVVTHGNVCALVESAAGTGVPANGVWSQVHTHNFDFSVWEMWVPLLAGGICVVVPSEVVADPHRFAHLLERHEVAVLNIVPSVFRGLAAAVAESGLRLPALREVIFGGEAVDAEVIRQWWATGAAEQAVLRNMYGITECTVHVTTHDLTPTSLDDAAPGTPIGRPLPHLRVELLDGGQPVPAGAIGEIHVAGTGVAQGYLGRRDLTAQRFVRSDGEVWYRSGDLARQLPDGTLAYVGRADDQVKVRGIRIEPGETEAALRAHPDVHQACVVAVRQPGGAVDLAAAVTPRQTDGARPDPALLRDHLLELLPVAFVPSVIRWLDLLPATESGKIDRAEVTALLAAARAEHVHSDDPLAQLWARAVGDSGAARTAGFLSLGGHSLSAVRLVADVEEMFGVRLPLTRLLRDNISRAELEEELAGAASRPVAPGDVAPAVARRALTSLQRRIWVQDRIDPEAAAYNVVAALMCPLSIEVDEVEAALVDTAFRHKALCSRIRLTTDGTPEWIADRVSRLRVERTPMPDGLSDDTVAREAARFGAGSIDLARELPVRFSVLFQQGAPGMAIVVSLHHIVSDQRSVEILFEEFAYLLQARAGGVAAELPAPVTYVDRPGADPAHQTALLAGAPDEIALPFRCGNSSGHQGHRAITRLDEEAGARVDALAAAVPTTAFVVFFTAACLVLRAWSGQRTMVFGVPASRRGSAEEHRVVDFLLDTVPVRIDVDSDATAAELITHVRDRFVTALDHGRVPFDDLVAALGRRVTPGRTPVFNVWLNDLTRNAEAPELLGSPTRYVEPARVVALFELNLYVRRVGGCYEVEFIGAAERLPADVLHELSVQFGRVLDTLTAAPEVEVAALELAPPQVREELAAPRLDRAITDTVRLLLADARHRGDAPAICSAHGKLSYAELADEVESFAERLRGHGVEEGSVVELRTERVAGFPVALLAIWSVGAVAGLVDPRWPDVQLTSARRALAPEHVVTSACEVERIEAHGRRLPGIGHVLFTSGTSGEQAGVLVPTTAVPAALEWYLDTFAPIPADRVAMLSGTAHDPVLRDVLVPLLAGAVCVVPDQDVVSSPADLVAFLAEQRVTVLHATPPLLRLMIAAQGERGRRLDALRLVVSGGAPLLPGVLRGLRKFTSAVVVNAYGLTESPQIAACHVLPHEVALADAVALPIGVGVNGTQVAVVDAVGRPAAVGQRGEVVLTGPHLAAGYLDDTARPGVFDLPGSVRTGDVGRISPDGLVYLDGRADRQVQHQGFRVELTAVEAVAATHPDVELAVAALLSEDAHDRLALQVEAAAGKTLRPEDLLRHLRDRLPAHAVPSLIQVVGRIRMDASNKAVWDERPSATERAPAVVDEDMEEAVITVVEQVLGRRIPVDENFFDAGLTSMGLLQAQAGLEQRLRRPVRVTGMFEHTTVRALAAHLVAAGSVPHVRRTTSVDYGALAAAGLARRDVRRRIASAQRKAAGENDLTRIPERSAGRRVANTEEAR